jgi:putative tryptophan/tyrosine transport system substrate-binding protein
MAIHIRRRDFIFTLGGAAAVRPFAAMAQQVKSVRRIGVLMAVANDAEGQARIKIFRAELERLGWLDGQNVQMDYRYGVGGVDRVRDYAAELIGTRPDVIVANGPQALAALRQHTSTIPIVFVQVADPVEAGFVASLPHPGGNITGFVSYEKSMAGKFLELLKEIAPGVTRVSVIITPDNATNALAAQVIEGVAASIGMPSTVAAVRDAAEIERSIDAFAHNSNGGLIVVANPITNTHRELIAALAARHRLPAVYQYRYFVTAGGLASYGPDVNDLFRRSASYVDRILKGEKAGDLPVQLPTKFELVINLKTARNLGLTINRELLLRADEVIE